MWPWVNNFFVPSAAGPAELVVVVAQREHTTPARDVCAHTTTDSTLCPQTSSTDPFLSFLSPSPWLPHLPHHLLLVQVTSLTSSHLQPLQPSTQPTKPSSKSFKRLSVLTALILGSTPPISSWSILSSHWQTQMIIVPKNTKSIAIKTHHHPPPLLNRPYLPIPMTSLPELIS